MGFSLTPEQAPTFNHDDRRKLGALWRRLQFLENRIDNHHGDPSHDKAEAAALRWVFEQMWVNVPARKERE